MKDKVFLDSGIFIAFLNRNDQYHSSAQALFSVESPSWFTSYLVISESYSYFLHKYGEEQARSFNNFIDSLPKLKIFDANKQHHVKVKKMLDHLRGTRLTYVDASSLCFLDENKISIVWATDHHLGITGASVLPR